MNKLRNSNLSNLSFYKIKEIQDYLKGYKDYPKSNVLKLIMEDNSFIAIRPSGTEPKYKVYYCIKDENKEKALNKFNAIKNELSQLFN